MISLTLHRQFTVPLECENVVPDVTAGLSHAEVAALPVFMGKRQYRLDEFFTVEGERSDQLEIAGDCAKVKWLGRGMSRGRLTVRGDAGMHLGSQMSGGTIEVTGNASDWVGAEMRGGTITVGGNAGGQIGAAYRGGTTGMRGGTIIIGGAAGLEVGMRMKRGTIIIRGPVRDFAGLQMRGGTIVLESGAEIRTGAWMARGTILSLVPLQLLPTFHYACSDQPVVVRLLSRALQPLGTRLPTDSAQGTWDRYAGDSSVPGKGEILVWRPA